MFERLVRNKVEFSQLKRQRRMIPEIRRALIPIYEELEDHPSVLDRFPIPGMGGVNSYFFTHESRETVDIQMSKVNHKEAEMVVRFFDYLVLNGMTPGEITVLTFYNGQRKLIMKKLRGHRQLQGTKFNVVTVDSYQGEENEIVLLSLVRSNVRGTIGFLEVENRVCVALSRARRGFYMFGDVRHFSTLLLPLEFPRHLHFLVLLSTNEIANSKCARRRISANPACYGGMSFKLWQKIHAVLGSICI